jgi:hypothetical protein
VLRPVKSGVGQILGTSNSNICAANRSLLYMLHVAYRSISDVEHAEARELRRVRVYVYLRSIWPLVVATNSDRLGDEHHTRNHFFSSETSSAPSVNR